MLNPTAAWLREFSRESVKPVHVVEFELTPMMWIDVTDFSTIAAGNAITVDWNGDQITVTEGTDWNAAATNAATARELADALNTAFRDAALSGPDGIGARAAFDAKRYGFTRIFIVGGQDYYGLARTLLTASTSLGTAGLSVPAEAQLGPTWTFCSGDSPIVWTDGEWVEPVLSLSDEKPQSIDAFTREWKGGEVTIQMTGERCLQMAELFGLTDVLIRLYVGTAALSSADYLGRLGAFVSKWDRPASGILSIEAKDSLAAMSELDVGFFDAANVHPLEYVNELVTAAFASTGQDVTRHLDGSWNPLTDSSKPHFVISRIGAQEETEGNPSVYSASQRDVLYGGQFPYHGVREATNVVDLVNEILLIMRGTAVQGADGRISFVPYDRNAALDATLSVGPNEEGYDTGAVEIVEGVGRIANQVRIEFLMDFNWSYFDTWRPGTGDIVFKYVLRNQQSSRFFGKKEETIESKMLNSAGFLEAKLSAQGNPLNPRNNSHLAFNEATNPFVYIYSAARWGFCGTRVRQQAPQGANDIFVHEDVAHNLSSTRLGYVWLFGYRAYRSAGPQVLLGTRWGEMVAFDSYQTNVQWSSLTATDDDRNRSSPPPPLSDQIWEQHKAAWPSQTNGGFIVPTELIELMGRHQIATSYNDEDFTAGRAGLTAGGWNFGLRGLDNAQDIPNTAFSTGRKDAVFAVDCTIAKSMAESILARWAWGAPEIKLSVRLDGLRFQNGDVIGLVGDSGQSVFNHSTLDGTIWEVQEASPDWDRGVVDLHLVWLRTDPSIGYRYELPAWVPSFEEPRFTPGDRWLFRTVRRFPFELQGTGASSVDTADVVTTFGQFGELQTGNGNVFYTVEADITGEDPDLANIQIGGRWVLSGTIDWNSSTGLSNLQETILEQSGEAANHTLATSVPAAGTVRETFTQGASRGGNWSITGTVTFWVLGPI